MKAGKHKEVAVRSICQRIIVEYPLSRQRLNPKLYDELEELVTKSLRIFANQKEALERRSRLRSGKGSVVSPTDKPDGPANQRTHPPVSHPFRKHEQMHATHHLPAPTVQTAALVAA